MHEVAYICDDDSENIRYQLGNDEFSAMFCTCSFRLPDRNCNCVHSISDACNNTTDNHLREGIGCSLENRADDEDAAPDQNCPSSAEFVSSVHRHQSAYYAANIISRNYLALNGHAWVFKGFEERLVVQKPAKDSLVITKEEETSTACCSNSVLKPFPLCILEKHGE